MTIQNNSLSQFLNIFEYRGERVTSLSEDSLVFGRLEVPMQNGIPHFTPDASYSTGNFSVLRDKHAELQLDSKNGTQDRKNTLLSRTQWPEEFFKGKTILECGCGAGADTEILVKLGARVIAVDLAGVDIAACNVGTSSDVTFVQASIMDLPFSQEAFDIVFCHRVLQHTPDPAQTLDHILHFVKPDGAVFVHSYSRDLYQMFRWKYALRPFTTRMDSEQLYQGIEKWAPALYRLTNWIRKLPGGRYFNWVFMPFLNYGHKPKFETWSDDQLIEYGIHDTFDALSPKYDIPLSEQKFLSISSRYLKRPFEIKTEAAITLLRTLL